MEYYIPIILALGANQANEAAAPVVNATPTEPWTWIIVLAVVGTLVCIALIMLIIESGNH